VTNTPPPTELERGLVLAVLAPGADDESELAEVDELVRAAGVEPVGSVVQHRARPARTTYVGKGKIEELKQAYAQLGAESLIVDDELEPAQQRFSRTPSRRGSSTGRS
jgi:GTP-binding protein HflX